MTIKKAGYEKKKDLVQGMFDDIAPKYDLLNHVLSLGIDKIWRRKVRNILKAHKPLSILDIAAGTADLSLAMALLNPVKITGIDISEKMLAVGRKKIHKRNLDGMIELIQADAEKLPFEDSCFDAVVVAFGVRNFENLNNGLKEIFRVLKKDGIFIVLEFSKPEKFPVKQVYNLYFHFILPKMGKFVSGNNLAYSYLPATVDSFPYGERFKSELKESGFVNCTCDSLSFGIACIYTGRKYL